uniref:Chitin-binding type-2 domain-containing protein n=1 Tax=Glossina palpalis gambiensis TaxID=67801 RepID=A0A1B0C6Y9_9MUSC
MKLKVCIIFLMLLIAVSKGYPYAYNGQPGCKTDEELQVKYYRFITNKTLYWKCVEMGKPAVVERCPNGQGYLDPVKSCVDFRHWYWTPLINQAKPPSEPDYQQGPYQGPYDYQGYYGPYGKYGPYGQHGPYGPYGLRD